jgi:hypothetical protein
MRKFKERNGDISRASEGIKQNTITSAKEVNVITS